MQLLTIIGARPQFIKAAALSRYIRDNPSHEIKETLLHTGQHYDQNMSDVFFEEMDIPRPDINLHVGSGNHGKTTGLMLERIEDEILKLKPDAVLVYGDTNSTLAGALTASKLHVPIAHVEAGLRSFMMSMPEEQNRRLTDHLSTWLFCPTQIAISNLKNEGITSCGEITKASPDNKYVTLSGDIMYDASLYYRQKITKNHHNTNFILLTVHRAENTDDASRLMAITKALNELSDCRFIFPVHPRTKNILQQENIKLSSHIELIEPVSYFEMLELESSCTAIVTDSGGVQKEAYFFKKPCITLRDSTEWIELVDAGWNTLTGANTERIIFSLRNLQIPSEYPAFYGDGNSAKNICGTLKKILQAN
jgi:UDP-GlcNAc3NAcA epimerase